MKNLTIYNPRGLHGVISATFPGSLSDECSVGTEVRLVDSTGDELCYADIMDLWVGALMAVPASVLELSHDPQQRAFTPLLGHLQRCGGSSEASDKISVLIMRIKDTTLIRPTNSQIDNLG